MMAVILIFKFRVCHVSIPKMTIRHTDVHNISLRIELLLAVLFIRRPDNFTLSQELFWVSLLFP